MKTYTVKVDLSNYHHSIETAELILTSPTGKSIGLPKRHRDIFTDDEKELWWKCIGGENWEYEIQLTREEMQTAVTISELVFRWNWIPRVKLK